MTTERPDFDQALKELLLRAPNGFLALVAPGLTWRGARSPELPAVARRADLVWEVTTGTGWRGLLHVELQTVIKADTGERMAEYGIRLWRRDHLPVRSLVVCLRPTRRLPTAPFVLEWLGTERLRYHYDVIALWKVPAERVLETANAALWPLAGVMGPDAAASVMASLPRQEQSELAGLLGLLAGVRLNRAAIREVLRRNPMLEGLLRESSMAEYFEVEGHARGRAEGRTEGRAEGRTEGLRMAARLALEGRFGALDEGLESAIAAADEATLEAVLRHSAAASLTELRQRLARQG